MRKTEKKELSAEAVLIVLAVASLAAFFYNKTLNIQAEKQRLAFDERRFELAQKCGEEGRNFFHNYQSQNTVATSTHQYLWLDPEFHFNGRLNTCLVYVGYADEITTGNAVFHDYRIIDSYSNKTLVFSWTSKVCASPSQCNEQVLDSYFEVPSVTTTQFFNRKSVLMSE